MADDFEQASETSRDVLRIETPDGVYMADKFIHPSTREYIYEIVHAAQDKITKKLHIIKGMGDTPAAALVQIYHLCKHEIECGANIDQFRLPKHLERYQKGIEVKQEKNSGIER